MTDAENPKAEAGNPKTGNPEDLTEAKEKFKRKYTAGICESLRKAGAIKDSEACMKETEKKVEAIADKWAKGWTEGIKKFLGIK